MKDKFLHPSIFGYSFTEFLWVLLSVSVYMLMSERKNICSLLACDFINFFFFNFYLTVGMVEHCYKLPRESVPYVTLKVLKHSWKWLTLLE